jgi:hypothetical protein
MSPPVYENGAHVPIEIERRAAHDPRQVFFQRSLIVTERSLEELYALGGKLFRGRAISAIEGQDCGTIGILALIRDPVGNVEVRPMSAAHQAWL